MKYSIPMLSALFLFHFLGGKSHAAIGEGYDWINNNKEELFDYTKYGVDSNWRTWYTDDNKRECPSGKDTSQSGMIRIYPFRNLGKVKNDVIVVYAIPRDKGKKLLKNGEVKSWSENDCNQSHIIRKSGQDGHYDCNKDSNLCYIALVGKSDDWAHRGCNAEDVYLLFPKEITDQWKNPYKPAKEDRFIDEYGTEHRIHSDYRCSNNLCWEPGNDRNCWDADVWYEISSDAESGRRTDQSPILPRSICEEVYSSGGGNTDPGNGGGTTDPPVVDNPWIGYKSRAGIRYVRASKEGKKRWKNKLEVSLLDIYDMDFRVKLKQKGGVWPEDTEASFYLSKDDVLDSGDTLLGTEDRDLTKYQNLKKKSIYLKGIDMADHIDRTGDWYVFVVVTYEGGANQSSPGDKDERVKITVLDPGLPDFITSNTKMGNRRGRRENYSWKINETAYIHAWIDNIGDIDWEGGHDHIKVPFYLSKGTKEDSHSQWLRIGREEIKKRKLKVRRRAKHEKIKFDLAYWANLGKVLPDRNYNIVVCADRDKDQNNGDGYVREKHKSNNCSEEMVFFVEHGDPIDVDLITGNLALTHGLTELQAGQKYGLQVEVSNVGTDQPWNGFRTIYEIKGPGTGGAWQMVADDGSNADQLYPGATQFEEITDGHGAKAPMVGGDYTFRACADYQQVVPETDEGNNCTELEVYIVPPPMPDLITHSLRLTHGRTSLTVGDLYGLEIGIKNIGEVTPESGFRSKYEIKGPGTNDQWQFVADDGSDADELDPGETQWEYITDNHGAHIPNTPGTYTARACADYQGKVVEEDEGNNCTEMTFEVNSVPTCVILNPLASLPTTGNFDMAATSIDFPAVIRRGDDMHPKAMNCTVSGSSPNTRAMWAFAKCDGTGFTHFDGDSDGGMRAGECTEEEVHTDRHSAGMEPGRYVMYFISNGESKVPESDYSNNVQAKVFRVE